MASAPQCAHRQVGRRPRQNAVSWLSSKSASLSIIIGAYSCFRTPKDQSDLSGFLERRLNAVSRELPLGRPILPNPDFSFLIRQTSSNGV